MDALLYLSSLAFPGWLVGKSNFNENPVIRLNLDPGLRPRVCQNTFEMKTFSFVNYLRTKLTKAIFKRKIKCNKNVLNMKQFTLQVLTKDDWKKTKKNLRVNNQRFEAVEVN